MRDHAAHEFTASQEIADRRAGIDHDAQHGSAQLSASFSARLFDARPHFLVAQIEVMRRVLGGSPIEPVAECLSLLLDRPKPAIFFQVDERCLERSKVPTI
jgi:hypothetical protein